MQAIAFLFISLLALMVSLNSWHSGNEREELKQKLAQCACTKEEK